MARISFVPLPEMGHINPSLKLAKQLSKRGHRVSYVGLIDLEELVHFHGLEFVPIFTRACPRGTLKELAELKLNYLDALFGKKALSSDPFGEIAAAIGTIFPDLLVIDIVLQDLALLARRSGIPCALISTSLHQVRLALIDTGYNAVLNHPILVLCPQALDFPNVARKTGQHYLEASIDLERCEPDRFPWEKLDPSKPLIYCSLGSHPQDYKENGAFLRAIVEAAKQRSEWQMVLAFGQAHVGDSVFREVPPNLIAVDWVPQVAMLEKASVMITHGGLGTVKECIYFGVPMVVFPMALDQPENAARIVYHGLGLRGSAGDVSAAKVLPLVDRVLADPLFRARVASMSAMFAEIEMSGIGVQVVEGILDRVTAGHD